MAQNTPEIATVIGRQQEPLKSCMSSVWAQVLQDKLVVSLGLE